MHFKAVKIFCPKFNPIEKLVLSVEMLKPTNLNLKTHKDMVWLKTF